MQMRLAWEWLCWFSCRPSQKWMGLQQLCSILPQRSQWIVVGNCSSSWRVLKYWVWQEAILSLLLFDVYGAARRVSEQACHTMWSICWGHVLVYLHFDQLQRCDSASQLLSSWDWGMDREQAGWSSTPDKIEMNMGWEKQPEEMTEVIIPFHLGSMSATN